MYLCTDKFFHEIVGQRLDFVSVKSLHDFDAKDDVRGIIVRLGVVVSRKIIEMYKNLRFIASITTGLDHVDLLACRERNIHVISLIGETQFLSGICATPEHTWGLLLALLRKTVPATQSVHEGAWAREPFFGHELQGKTIGIIGLGRVGKIISDYALAFRMKVVAFDILPVTKSGIENASLQKLSSESDIVTIHLPLDNSTRDFLNASVIAKMARRPWIINTSRGAIVNQDDVIQALNLDLIRGYACDVLAEELSATDGRLCSKLIDLAQIDDRVLITPHIAGSTFESMTSTAEFIYGKLCSKNLIPT